MNNLDELCSKLKYEGGLLFWETSPNRKLLPGSKAGSLDVRGYVFIRYKRKVYKAHRVIWYMFHKELPEEIDHINNIKDDNRIENLRSATRLTNMRNQSTQRVDKSSKFKGVSYSNTPRLKKKWVAYITLEKKRTHIGSFYSEEEAALAYNKKAVDLFGEFASLNQIN